MTSPPPSVQTVIVGIDEAGRGALAGPVVAGACVLADALSLHPLIRDSKELTAEQRGEAFAFIIAHCPYGVGIVDHAFIDANGILAATERAMQEAVAELAKIVTPTYLLIDGRDQFWFDYPKSSIIKGDQKELCIAAASIVAKVTRDRLMMDYARAFPHYGFDVHKGYGTPEHFGAIRKNGPCRLHRRTFISPSPPSATACPRVSSMNPRSSPA